MSRLEELIQELCPDGVEYRRMGEVILSLNTGLNPRQFFKLNSDDAKNYYVTIREIHGGKIVFSEKTDRINDEAMKLCNNRSKLEKNDVLFSGTGTIGETIVLSETPKNWNIKEGVYAIKPNPEWIEARFLSHLLGCETIKTAYMKKAAGGTVKSIPMAELKMMIIPVPPLEIQSEIVRILDKFTEITAELKDKLTAELTARRKQLNWYRAKVLLSGGKMQTYCLEDIAKIIDCPHSSPKWQTEGVPCIRNFNLVNGTIDTSKISYVSEEDYIVRTKRVVPSEGDILFSREAPIGNVGMIPNGFKCCQGQRVVLLRPNISVVFPRFLLHALQGDEVKKQIYKVGLGGTTVSNYNLSDLRKLLVSVPSMEEQKRISDVLDTMNTYSVNIENGLPAEIGLRNSQYEYYRDELLHFDRIG